MENYFDKVRNYLLELEYTIKSENKQDQVFVIDKEDDGISNMIIAVADPIVIMEQTLFTLKSDDVAVLKQLLIKNRDIIHGALVLDDKGKHVIFRDTLQVENLDLNELEASLNSLSLLMSEFSDFIIKHSA